MQMKEYTKIGIFSITELYTFVKIIKVGIPINILPQMVIKIPFEILAAPDSLDFIIPYTTEKTTSAPTIGNNNRNASGEKNNENE